MEPSIVLLHCYSKFLCNIIAYSLESWSDFCNVLSGFILHRCRPYGALFYWCCRFLHRCRPYGAEDGFYGIIRFLSRDSEIPPMILFNFQLSVGIRSSFLPLAIGSPSAVSSQLLSVGIRSSLLPLAIGSPSAISNQLLSVGIRSSLLQKRRGSEISSAGKVKRCG